MSLNDEISPVGEKTPKHKDAEYGKSPPNTPVEEQPDDRCFDHGSGKQNFLVQTHRFHPVRTRPSDEFRLAVNPMQSHHKDRERLTFSPPSKTRTAEFLDSAIRHFYEGLPVCRSWWKAKRLSFRPPAAAAAAAEAGSREMRARRPFHPPAAAVAAVEAGSRETRARRPFHPPAVAAAAAEAESREMRARRCCHRTPAAAAAGLTEIRLHRLRWRSPGRQRRGQNETSTLSGS
jgi:hypothetical protein